MTIKECIDIVDNAKPNQYSIKEKVMWLSFVDETIINDVLKTHEGYDGRYDDFTGYTEDKLSVPLIVPSPYDRLYPQYIKMMIDSENGETARYNNSAALYNTYLTEYKKWYNKTHMPINGTLKAPSPVNININSGLSEAQIENIKRQLYYMLSQDVGEVISPDKLYDIVTNYVLNNLEMIRANDGKDGKDGKDGTLWIPFKFDVDIQKGEKKLIQLDFVHNYDIDKADYPNIEKWSAGDYIVDKSVRILVVEKVEMVNSEFWNITAECIFETPEPVVDQSYDPNSRNAVSGRAMAEVFVAMDAYKANTDLSNVSNEDFRAKAEEAGVGGDAGLTEEKCIMEFMGVVSELPSDAEEGQVYKLDAWRNIGSFNADVYGGMAFYPSQFAMFIENGWNEVSEHISSNFEQGISYKIVTSEKTYIYANCDGLEVGSVEMMVYGETTDTTEDEYSYGTVTVYELPSNVKDASFVRFNGEWVEL